MISKALNLSSEQLGIFRVDLIFIFYHEASLFIKDFIKKICHRILLYNSCLFIIVCRLSLKHWYHGICTNLFETAFLF